MDVDRFYCVFYCVPECSRPSWYKVRVQLARNY